MTHIIPFAKKIWLPALLVLVVSNGCKKDFLDRSPLGSLTYENFFQTADQAVQATNAVYNEFRTFDCVGLGYLGCTDIISDDADKGSTLNDQPLLSYIDDFTMDASNSFIAQVWRGYYRIIARANLAIKRVPDVDMDPALRDRLVGECKFLRAYSYFLLVQWFGELPIITEPLAADDYYNQTRQPVSAVYDQIESDLLAAIQVLPQKNKYPGADLGRATRGAAEGILAKLYMIKKDYPKALGMCRSIIDSNQYSLLPKYADNFMRVGENGAESIFEIGAVALQATVAGPGASPYNMIQGVRGVPNLGWGFNRPSDNLVAAYENGDPRREATVIYVGEVLPDGSTQVQDNPEIIGERFNQKAWVPNHSGLQDNGPGNIRILRYSDILLLTAEAYNETDQPDKALPLLNQVRKRARGTNNFILPDVTVMDKTQLRERIYKERRVELAMEQQRWFDLLRWGRAASVMQAVGKTSFKPGTHELLPIPQTEIDLTERKLSQNNGYN